MSKYTKITISTNNDAFQPDPAPELARILRQMADDLESGNNKTIYRDLNGNTAAVIKKNF